MESPADFPDDHAFVELLVPGVSSDGDLEPIMKDTEDKLILNANSIEQQLKEIQAKMFDPRAGDCPQSPSEFLQWFSLRSHSSARPVTTGQQDFLDFLRALQLYLRSEEEGREEVTLQLLLTLSSQCGVYFPCTPSSSSSCHPDHTTLVHTVRDEASLEFQQTWDDVRLHLRCHLLDRLSPRDPEDPGPTQMSVISIPERVHCLQQLLFLYPESEVLTYYQGLRSQCVQSILRPALSSSPGGETHGFDRLALCFHSAIPALTQALTAELQVLSRLSEPPAVLGFLNAAYLGTVAQELACMVERESEMALRDNTSISGKIKKYSAKSRATVAPMELPMKNRSFSLTSHQLRALTQLASSLLGFESSVRELVTNIAFINCMEHAPCIKGILKKSREDSDVTTDSGKSTADTPQTPQAQVLEFNWRSAFQGLVPHMEHCVKVVLDDVCAKTLQKEEALYSSGHTSLTMCGATALTAAGNTLLREETPKSIAQFCGTIVAELDALLPLAVACRDSSLLEVRSSFVEACGRAAFAVLGRLQHRALAVPSSAPVRNLPALLASCIYVQERLKHYHGRLRDSNAAKVPLTLLPIQKYQETVDALKNQLTGYCVQVCSDCILQDAESHHWADPKPFYEGERCSFSVQMWFYFLCGLRSDVWAMLPPDMAKDVLGQVLTETLQMLVQRYARARPSYKRYLQIRGDIAAILLYVEQLMWSLCDSPEALVRAEPSPAIDVTADWPYQIHSLCDQLLTVLVVVTAPLTLLHRTFMINPTMESVPQPPDSSFVYWLTAINPDLFTEQVVRHTGLMGPSAFACQLRLLTSDPGCNPKLLLRMLLCEDCHLPRILLENSHLCQENTSEISAESCQAGENFLVTLVNLFSCLNNVPEALTQALQPYLERAQVWEHLYTLPDSTRTAPVLISCVRSIITKSTKSLLEHLVSMVMGWPATEEPSGEQNIPGNILAKIPKEWNYSALETQGKETPTKTVTTLAIQSVSFILTNLPMVVASVPLPVRFLFHMAEKHLSQHTRQLRSVGLLLWALLGCLIQGLEDPNKPEHISDSAPDRRAKDRLSLLAECLQAVMGIQQRGVPKPSVLKVLQALEEKRPKWMDVQLQKARKLCSNSVFERERESGVAAAELTEQKIGLMLLEVCHKAGGSDYLRQIYHIIQGNEELLLKLCGGSEPLNDPPGMVNFALSSDSPDDAPSFNPLHQFDHVGNKKLEQSAVVDWAWDWSWLLPAYQGMSRVTFTTLLANRWEMQEDAELDDGERAMTEDLHRAFLVQCCSSSAGPQEPAGAQDTGEELLFQRETQPDESAA